MEKPRKSKALIITFILILLLLIVGYWLFAKKDQIFRTDGINIGRIFEPLVETPGIKPLQVIFGRIFPNLAPTIPPENPDYDPNNNINTYNLPVVNISASPSSVKPGESSIITWTSTNAMSCKTPDGTVVGTSGSFSTGVLNESKSFSISCTGDNGTISRDINIKVGDRKIDPFLFPIVNARANPSPIDPGGSSTISWDSINTDSCDTGVGNPTTVSGSFDTGILYKTRSYSVICTGKDGTSSRNAFVIVKDSGNYNGTTCKNGTDNYPLCTTLKGQCINGAVNPPTCTTSIDNKCLNGAINPEACNIFENAFCRTNKITEELSDKKNTNKDQIKSLQSVLSKLPSSLGSTYLKDTDIDGDYGPKTKTAVILFQKDNNINQTGIVDTETSTVLNNKCNEFFNNNDSSRFSECNDDKDNDMDNKIDSEDPSCHTDFNTNNSSSYDKYIGNEARVKTLAQCGDGKDNDGDGLVDYKDPQCHTDENVDNWESYYANIQSERGGIPTPTETCRNGAVNYPNCTVGANGLCLNGATNPDECTIFSSKTCDNGATNWPRCTTLDGLCLNGATNPDECTQTNKEVNKCAIFDQYPLEFTDDEKTKLADLLRKFYLLAPTIKTEDDLDIVYSEIDRYKSLINQTKELTRQCYLETDAPTYTGPKTRFGNPWFKTDSVGSYVDPVKYNEVIINTNPDYVLKYHDHYGDTSSHLITKYPPVQMSRKYRINWEFSDNYNINAVMLDRLQEFETLLNIW